MILTEVQRPGVMLPEVCREHSVSPALVSCRRAASHNAGAGERRRSREDPTWCASCAPASRTGPHAPRHRRDQRGEPRTERKV